MDQGPDLRASGDADVWYSTGSQNYRPGSQHPTDYIFGVAAAQIRTTSATTPMFLHIGPQAPHLPAVPPARHANAAVALPPIPPSFNEADVSDKPAPQNAAPPLTAAQISQTRRIASRSGGPCWASTTASRRCCPRCPTPAAWRAPPSSSRPTTATCSASTGCSRRDCRTRSRATSRSSCMAGRGGPDRAWRGQLHRHRGHAVRGSRGDSAERRRGRPLAPAGHRDARARRGLTSKRPATTGTACAPPTSSTPSGARAPASFTTWSPIRSRWSTSPATLPTPPPGPRSATRLSTLRR